jgi:hypothetical protein
MSRSCQMLALVVLFISAGCRRGEERVLGVVPKGANHIFWQTVHAGAIKAAGEFGYMVDWNAPTLEIDAGPPKRDCGRDDQPARGRNRARAGGQAGARGGDGARRAEGDSGRDLRFRPSTRTRFSLMSPLTIRKRGAWRRGAWAKF